MWIIKIKVYNNQITNRLLLDIILSKFLNKLLLFVLQWRSFTLPSPSGTSPSITKKISIYIYILGTWNKFLGFQRDGATSMFWHRNKLQPTSHQSTIFELVLTLFIIPFKCEQHIIFELRLCRNSSWQRLICGKLRFQGRFRGAGARGTEKSGGPHGTEARFGMGETRPCKCGESRSQSKIPQKTVDLAVQKSHSCLWNDI